MRDNVHFEHGYATLGIYAKKSPNNGIINSKCLHNRPDGYILNDRHYVCERLHACAEVSSKPNKKEKSGCFDTRKPYLNCSFQDDDTQGFQNILAMCLLRPEQRNKLKGIS